MEHAKYKIRTQGGSYEEVKVSLADYMAAGELGMSLAEHLNLKYGNTVDLRAGTPFEQMVASAGIFLRNDFRNGIRAPSMKEIMHGNSHMNVGALTRPDGADNNTITGRMLFPQIVMELIAHELEEDHSDFMQGYQDMVATTASVTSPRFDQPIINKDGPKDAEYSNQPIAQLAPPPAMLGITLADVQRSIPTRSIGLQISDEALAATTLDLVGIIVTQQAREERIRMVENDLAAMISGDTDRGETALNSITAKSLDDSIDENGKITQMAWIKYLRRNYRKMSISHIICDIDMALALEGREGKPTVLTDDPTSRRIDSLFNVENLGITPPKVLLVDNDVTGANTLVGLDKRAAIRRVLNVAASYQAIEEFVLRRGKGMRFDFGETAHKLYDDAWSVMTLTTT